MMKHAVEEATLIIPVVAFGTLTSGSGAMWEAWKKTLHQQRWRSRIPAVVVTKARREDGNHMELEILQDAVAFAVWGTVKQCNRVLFCDSLIGLGAMQLGRQFSQYTEIQDQDDLEWSSEYSHTLAENIQNPSSPMRYVLIFRSGCQIKD